MDFTCGPGSGTSDCGMSPSDPDRSVRGGSGASSAVFVVEPILLIDPSADVDTSDCEPENSSWGTTYYRLRRASELM